MNFLFFIFQHEYNLSSCFYTLFLHRVANFKVLYLISIDKTKFLRKCGVLQHSIITIENLHFYREMRAIFKDVSLSIPQGKITAIMGPSGTGKTTLLRLMGGQLNPSEGRIIVNDVNLQGLSKKALFQLRRKMGVLFQ